MAACLPILAMLTSCGSASDAVDGSSETADIPIGLYTSLPIVWRETHDMRDLLRPDGSDHWALEVIAAHGRLEPLDTLALPQGMFSLPSHALLVLAQPRPLSPDENVALDSWTRQGGRVLLFADPMLTQHSIFALGDKRRPQDVILLSPILRRWGLDLQFDDAQPAGERTVEWSGLQMPINLAGRFEVLPEAKDCRTAAQGLVAECRIGGGRLVAIADAALLEESEGPDLTVRRRALAALLDRVGGL